MCLLKGYWHLAKHIWVNGDLVPPDQATVSVFDHGLLYGDGVFEGIRVYNGRIFKLATHLRRLEASANSIRLTLSYSLDELAAATRLTVEANDCRDGYIRLCVTRGAGTLGLNPFVCKEPFTFIIAGAISMYPPQLYGEGLSVITSSMIRNHPSALSPRIKSLNYLNNILAKIEALDQGLFEAVMLNHEGNVAECTGDNIFIVNHNKAKTPVLSTPPLHAGILEGVTRNTVIGLARQAGMEVVETDLKQQDLYEADEMFLTGTAAEVIPVTSMDGKMIGNGKPGKTTVGLINAFRQLVASEAPED